MWHRPCPAPCKVRINHPPLVVFVSWLSIIFKCANRQLSSPRPIRNAWYFFTGKNEIFLAIPMYLQSFHDEIQCLLSPISCAAPTMFYSVFIHIYSCKHSLTASQIFRSPSSTNSSVCRPLDSYGMQFIAGREDTYIVVYVGPSAQFLRFALQELHHYPLPTIYNDESLPPPNPGRLPPKQFEITRMHNLVVSVE